MDEQTQRLHAALDQLHLRIAIIQGLLRSGHELTHEDLSEWSEAVEQHAMLYHGMQITLYTPAILETVH